MPEPGGTSRDFASQPTEQGEHSHSTPWRGPYNSKHNSNEVAAPVYAPSPATLDFPDFGAHPPAQFGGYTFSDASTAWDWTQNLDFAEFTTVYEPQGELAHELRDQKNNAPPGDFNIPPPVNPLEPSPPPPPPRRVPRPPPQGVQTGVKRKAADSEPNPAVSQIPSERLNQHKRSAVSRASSIAETAVVEAPSVPTAQTVSTTQDTESQPNLHASGDHRKDASVSKSESTGPGRVMERRVAESPPAGGEDLLPAGKVFPIQIGSTLFRLSGASLSSDAPSYFSHFFLEQLRDNSGVTDKIRTLYIDRDPDTFHDIALHLQGYHIVPRDGEHYVKLFADAQFYSLPRLTKQLFNADIFIRIGNTPFTIPRDLFSGPGNSPNYFTLGFAHFFSRPSDAFPGLNRSALLRPPPISPPAVPNRSPAIFRDLITMLQGYDLEIRGPQHRAMLLRDARYFHLKGLEQRLVPCDVRWNSLRSAHEITIRLEDIRQSGVGVLSATTTTSALPLASYARPYTTDTDLDPPPVLVVETTSEATLRLSSSSPSSPFLSSIFKHLGPTSATVVFAAQTQARLAALTTVLRGKLGAHVPAAPASTSTDKDRGADRAGGILVRIDAETALELDGVEVQDVDCGEREREVEWTVRRAQWRVGVEVLEGEGEDPRAVRLVLSCVRMQAWSGERGRNVGRGFLG